MQNFKSLSVGPTNAFLLKAQDGYLLIDTTLPGKLEAFTKALLEQGVELKEIKYILLTHHHVDHAGLVETLLQQTGAVLIVHEVSVPLITRGITTIKGTIPSVFFRFYIKLTLLFDKAYQKDETGYIKENAYTPIDKDRSMVVVEEEESDFLKSIGINGTIIHTPGHTHDNLSVLLDDGTTFTGDITNNFFKPPYPPIIEDEELMCKSWNRLISKGAKMLYPPHGKPFSIEKIQEVLTE